MLSRGVYMTRKDTVRVEAGKEKEEEEGRV
jgi:hypothetical protein